MVTYPASPVIRESAYASFGKLAIKGKDVAATGTSGLLQFVVAAGTAAATDVTVSAMAVGDSLISVIAVTATTAAVTDRTAEYVVAAGKLTKAAGTNETGNKLIIIYANLT